MSFDLEIRPAEQGYLFAMGSRPRGLVCPACHSRDIGLGQNNEPVCLECHTAVKVNSDWDSQEKLAISLVTKASREVYQDGKVDWNLLNKAQEVVARLQKRDPIKISWLVYTLDWLLFTVYGNQDKAQKAISYGKKAVSALRKWTRAQKEDFDCCFLLARACNRLGEYIEGQGTSKDQALSENLFRQSVKWMEKAQAKSFGMDRDAATTSLQSHIANLIYKLDVDSKETDALLVRLSDMLLDNVIVSEYLEKLTPWQKARHTTLYTDLRRDFPWLIETFMDARKPERFARTVDALIDYQKELLEVNPEEADRLRLLLQTWKDAAQYYSLIQAYEKAAEIDQEALDFYQDLDLKDYEAQDRLDLMIEGMNLAMDQVRIFVMKKDQEKAGKAIILAQKLLDQLQEQFDGDYFDYLQIKLLWYAISTELLAQDADKAQAKLQECLEKLDRFSKTYPHSMFVQELKEGSQKIEQAVVTVNMAKIFNSKK